MKFNQTTPQKFELELTRHEAQELYRCLASLHPIDLPQQSTRVKLIAALGNKLESESAS